MKTDYKITFMMLITTRDGTYLPVGAGVAVTGGGGGVLVVVVVIRYLAPYKKHVEFMIPDSFSKRFILLE